MATLNYNGQLIYLPTEAVEAVRGAIQAICDLGIHRWMPIVDAPLHPLKGPAKLTHLLVGPGDAISIDEGLSPESVPDRGEVLREFIRHATDEMNDLLAQSADD